MSVSFQEWVKNCQHQLELFLADRLVMMTNGPAAKIGEILNIPFDHPRDRDLIMEDPEYYNLRNYALDFLYHRFAHDDD